MSRHRRQPSQAIPATFDVGEEMLKVSAEDHLHHQVVGLTPISADEKNLLVSGQQPTSTTKQDITLTSTTSASTSMTKSKADDGLSTKI